ncbi:TniQ family protein [Leptolyngbya sp. FACHB-671]|nr:TniQ family protein [Leptolyngbya sp. FACHB-671]
MLSFFPKPYPDELLYSILARYHIRSGNTSPKLTLQELFGSRTAIATADLPSNLGAVASNLSLISGVTPQELVQNHTLYPFYAAFLPKERSQQVLEAMKSEQGGAIHDKVGIRASSVRVPKFFRFCPQCIQEDQTRYGELYWHRIHQVPGVVVCPHHAEVLQDSSVTIQGFNRHEYQAASPDTCVAVTPDQALSNKALQILQKLAQDVDFLLTHDLPARDLNWFSQQYTTLLIERGLATATGRVHQHELLDQFLYFYGHSVLAALDSAVERDDDHTWLSNIVRKHRKVFHPIRHLLMMRFLQVPIADFWEGDRTYLPFGAGPWLCLNAAAKHYLKPVVTRLDISRCYDTKKPAGTFSCSCGFIYCRTGPDTTEEDTGRVGKIKEVGALWQQRLRHFVEVERLGLRQTARQLNVDPNTVKRYVRLLGLTPAWQSSTSVEEPKTITVSALPETHAVDAKNQHRETWKTLQRKHPHSSKTALRRMAPATYTWLYKHDRKWLHRNSPSARRPIAQVNRVDWQQRDEQILAKVKQAVQKLLAVEKPVQITVSRVAKAIAQLALIEQHIDKMSLTRTYLDSVVETVEDFQIRRIQWVVKQLDQQGEAIEHWKVVRMAGLKPGYSKKVETALEHTAYARM